MSQPDPSDRALRWALPLLPAAVALVLLGLVLLLAERIVGRELERRAGFRVEQAAQLYADQLSRLLARRAAELELLGQMPRSGMAPDAWRAQMQRLKDSSGSFVWIGATDAVGRVQVATDGLLEGLSIANRDVFVNGRSGLWFGSLHPPVALKEPLRLIGLPVPLEMADIALPVLDDRNQPVGVLATHLDARHFEELRQGVLGPPEARRELALALVDGDGDVLIGEQPTISAAPWRALLTDPANQHRLHADRAGEALLLSSATVVPVDSALRTPWQVVAWQPLAAAQAPVRALEQSLLAWGGGTALLLGLGGFAVARRLGKPYGDAEAKLREQGEVLSAVINSASDAVISVDETGRITLFNPAAARIFGHGSSLMIGQPLDVLLPPAERGPHVGHLKRFAESRATTRPMGVGRVNGVRADGEPLELEASISQITVRGEKVLTAILRDVTERVRAERALASHQAELSELTHRLLNQEKDTTRRLAQTLHDQLGQTLGALRLSFDALGGLLPPGLSPQAQERQRKLAQLIDTANTEVRQALMDLRPPRLDDEGLEGALTHEIRTRALEVGPCQLRLVVDPVASGLRWPAHVEHAAFMVAREALANAALHAQASNVVVRLEGTVQWLRLSVSDDGVGLPPEGAVSRPGHLGMVGMRERALAIGGHLEVQSPRGGGTEVTLVWGTHGPDRTAS